MLNIGNLTVVTPDDLSSELRNKYEEDAHKSKNVFYRMRSDNLKLDNEWPPYVELILFADISRKIFFILWPNHNRGFLKNKE